MVCVMVNEPTFAADPPSPTGTQKKVPAQAETLMVRSQDPEGPRPRNRPDNCDVVRVGDQVSTLADPARMPDRSTLRLSLEPGCGHILAAARRRPQEERLAPVRLFRRIVLTGRRNGPAETVDELDQAVAL